jgi:hypothetical protein
MEWSSDIEYVERNKLKLNKAAQTALAGQRFQKSGAHSLLDRHRAWFLPGTRFVGAQMATVSPGLAPPSDYAS